MYFVFIIDYFVARQKDNLQRRVLDAAARRRRQRKALEALEADNFQDDPHADLKMSKRAPKFEEMLGGEAKGIHVYFFYLGIPCIDVQGSKFNIFFIR